MSRIPIHKMKGWKEGPDPLDEKPKSKVEMDSKLKQNLIYIGFIGFIIIGLYYFMSPYQNCIRDMDAVLSQKYEGKQLSSKQRAAKVKCIQLTSW